MRYVNSTDKRYKAISLKRPISKLAHMMAKISLKFNFLVFEFIELYKFHVVKLARKQYSEYSIVELSARTGLDRRYISETLKNEKLKETPSKIILVLNQIRKICINNHTKFIVKHGGENSFDDICLKISSSSLTSSAIAKELIRQGELVDHDTQYKIVNLVDTPTEKSLIYLHENRNILSEMKKYCNDNNTFYIPKYGKSNSFEYIFLKNKSGMFSLDKIAQELIEKGFMNDCGDKYKLIEWIYLANHKNAPEYIELLSEELERLTNTIISNYSTPEERQKFYQRNSYSTKIKPEKYPALKPEIINILKKTNIEIGRLLDENETNVPRYTFPPFGASLFSFKDNSTEE